MDSLGLIQIVPDPDDIPTLPETDRGAMRVLMTSATRGCSAEIADALPNLAFVVSQGAGQELIDAPYLSRRGIGVRVVGEALTDDVADLAMALTHMLCRNLLQADAFARSGEWRQGRFALGDSVVGMTMGIAGLSGRIGQAIATRATASRMKIAGLNRPSNAGLSASLHDGWTALAAACDVLVLALPGDAGPQTYDRSARARCLGTERPARQCRAGEACRHRRPDRCPGEPDDCRGSVGRARG